MPYAFIESVNGDKINFYHFTMPGQLFIKGTIFIPTLISMILIMVTSLLLAGVNLIKRIQNIFFKYDNLAYSQGPEPIAGSMMSREDRCLSFAVNIAIGFLLTAMGGSASNIFSMLFF